MPASALTARAVCFTPRNLTATFNQVTCSVSSVPKATVLDVCSGASHSYPPVVNNYNNTPSSANTTQSCGTNPNIVELSKSSKAESSLQHNQHPSQLPTQLNPRSDSKPATTHTTSSHTKPQPSTKQPIQNAYKPTNANKKKPPQQKSVPLAKPADITKSAEAHSATSNPQPTPQQPTPQQPSITPSTTQHKSTTQTQSSLPKATPPPNSTGCAESRHTDSSPNKQNVVEPQDRHKTSQVDFATGALRHLASAINSVSNGGGAALHNQSHHNTNTNNNNSGTSTTPGLVPLKLEPSTQSNDENINSHDHSSGSSTDIHDDTSTDNTNNENHSTTTDSTNGLEDIRSPVLKPKPQQKLQRKPQLIAPKPRKKPKPQEKQSKKKSDQANRKRTTNNSTSSSTNSSSTLTSSSTCSSTFTPPKISPPSITPTSPRSPPVFWGPTAPKRTDSLENQAPKTQLESVWVACSAMLSPRHILPKYRSRGDNKETWHIRAGVDGRVIPIFVGACVVAVLVTSGVLP